MCDVIIERVYCETEYYISNRRKSKLVSSALHALNLNYWAEHIIHTLTFD